MKSYRVAILGCRSRGAMAASAYHAHPRTELVGLCDLRQEPLDTLGQQVGVAARFTDLDEMIRSVKPDIVAIPTGTEFHFDLAMRVVDHGIDLEVEKPMCANLEQADALMARANERGVRVAVHHQVRVGPEMQAMARAYTAGRIGKLRYMVGSGKGYYGGYGLMNIGCHIVNNFLKFAGACRSVSATASTGGRAVTPSDVIASPSGMGIIVGECITATLQFDDNVTATLLHHRFPIRDNHAYLMELYGTEGRMIWSHGAWYLGQPHFIPDGQHDQWERLELDHTEPVSKSGEAELNDYYFVDEYVRALDKQCDHECSGADGRHTLEILMGIFESAAYGHRIDLPQVQRDHPLLRWRSEHGLGKPTEVPRHYPDWLKMEDERLGRL